MHTQKSIDQDTGTNIEGTSWRVIGQGTQLRATAPVGKLKFTTQIHQNK